MKHLYQSSADKSKLLLCTSLIASPKSSQQVNTAQTQLSDPKFGFDLSKIPISSPHRPSQSQVYFKLDNNGDKYQQEADLGATQIVKRINNPNLTTQTKERLVGQSNKQSLQSYLLPSPMKASPFQSKAMLKPLISSPWIERVNAYMIQRDRLRTINEERPLLNNVRKPMKQVMRTKDSEWMRQKNLRVSDSNHIGKEMRNRLPSTSLVRAMQNKAFIQMKWDHLFNDIPKTLQDVPKSFKRAELDSVIQQLITLRDKKSNGQDGVHQGPDQNAIDFGLMSNSFRIAVNAYERGDIDEKGLREATFELWKNSIDNDVARTLGKEVESDIKAWKKLEKNTWAALGKHF